MATLTEPGNSDFDPRELFDKRTAIRSYCGKDGCYGVGSSWDKFQDNTAIDSWYSSPITCNSTGRDATNLKACATGLPGTGANADLVTVGAVTTHFPSCNLRACASLNGSGVSMAGGRDVTNLICGDSSSGCATYESMKDQTYGWVTSTTLQDAIECPVGYYAKYKFTGNGAGDSVECARITEEVPERYWRSFSKTTCSNAAALRQKNRYFENPYELKQSTTSELCLKKCAGRRDCAGCSATTIDGEKYYQMIPWKTNDEGVFELQGGQPVPECNFQSTPSKNPSHDDVQFFTKPLPRKCTAGTVDGTGATTCHNDKAHEVSDFKKAFCGKDSKCLANPR